MDLNVCPGLQGRQKERNPRVEDIVRDLGAQGAPRKSEVAPGKNGGGFHQR